MNPVAQFAVQQIEHNSFLTGALGAGAFGYVLVQIRSFPKKIWDLFIHQFTSELTVYGEDDFAEPIAYYLSHHPSIKKSRILGINDQVPWSDRENILTAGTGHHILWNGFHTVFLHKTEEKTDRGNRLITMRFRVFGRSREPLKNIIYSALALRDNSVKVSVYFYGASGYSRSKRLTPRALSSVFIDDDIMSDIVRDAESFSKAKAWYADRGIPYRRGYMLDGPPGTGKSSLIFALASHLNKSLYVINPASVLTDQALAEAFDVPEDSIIVIEDLDAISVSQQRVSGEKKEEEHGITLSGLLNAIDGVGASEGRILIVTTNHPENLDSALMRPGRIDRKFHIGALDHDLALAMCERFLGDEAGEEFFDRDVVASLPIIPANLQNMLLIEVGKEPIEIVDENPISFETIGPKSGFEPTPKGGLKYHEPRFNQITTLQHTAR